MHASTAPLVLSIQQRLCSEARTTRVDFRGSLEVSHSRKICIYARRHERGTEGGLVVRRRGLCQHFKMVTSTPKLHEVLLVTRTLLVIFNANQFKDRSKQTNHAGFCGALNMRGGGTPREQKGEKRYLGELPAAPSQLRSNFF